MKKTTLNIAISAALLALTASAQAGDFGGGYIGAKAGWNRSTFSGPATVNGVPNVVMDVAAKNAGTGGLELGYNWDNGGYLLGIDGFVDFNAKATHNATAGGVAGTTNYGSTVAGADLKLGVPGTNWLPYVKVGYANTKANGGMSGSGNGLHAGIGLEYKFAPHWSFGAEYTATNGKSNGANLKNNNLTFGLNYYFSGPAAAPAPAPVAKPAPAPAPVAAPAPAPAPKESWKVIKEQKPVTIEGANFDTGSSKLKPAVGEKLKPVVEFAKKYPEAGLEVHGHTDNVGKKATNEKLSQSRADSVKAYLVKQGIDAKRITTKGYADSEPVADNKTKEGRAKNRRVEIHYTVIEEKKVKVTQ
jgi:OOP family OmpA-OmpF porin